MKRLFLRLFLRDKLIGQIAAAAASALAAYLMTLIPGLPGLVQITLSAALQLPEGTQITQSGLTATLTPIFLAILNALIQELVIRDNNKLLAELKADGVYEGPLDGWVGEIARDSVKALKGKK